jgi:DnaJ-class molecular chaperone
MSDSREHQECPVFCELCGERLAAVTCEACRGSGCLPNAEMAYLECGTCAGVGKVHNGCAEMTYAQLTARAEAAEQAIQRVRWQCDSWSHGNSWNKAARKAILRTLDGGAS